MALGCHWQLRSDQTPELAAILADRHALENLKLAELGRAWRITIDKDNTTIVEGYGKPADIEGRVKVIRAQIEESTSR